TVRYQLIQLDQPLSTLLGQGWITQQGLDPERLQHRGQPAADLAYADDADRPVLPGRGRLLGEGQQAAQHVFHHAPGVAAGRTGHLDPRRRKTGQIQMVGACGPGTDDTYRPTGQHRRGDPGHRSYQQHIGIPQGGLVEESPGQAGEATQLAEELVEPRYVFIGNDVHGNPPG